MQQLIVQVVAWLVLRGLDQLIAKWVAYFNAAWDRLASDEAKRRFNDGLAEVRQNLDTKAGAWDEWRKKAGQPVGSSDREPPSGAGSASP